MDTNGNGRNDSATHEIDAYINKLTETVEAVTAAARNDASQMRDRMDNVLKAINDQAARLQADIEAYRAIARELADVVKVAGEPFDRLAEQFRTKAPPSNEMKTLPPATIEMEAILHKFSGGRRPAEQ